MKPVALLFIEEKLWSWTLALTGSWYFAGNQLFCWQWPVSNPTNKWRIIDHLWLKVNRLHRGFPTVGRDEIWNILLITQAKLLILRMENFLLFGLVHQWGSHMVVTTGPVWARDTLITFFQPQHTPSWLFLSSCPDSVRLKNYCQVRGKVEAGTDNFNHKPHQDWSWARRGCKGGRVELFKLLLPFITSSLHHALERWNS